MGVYTRFKRGADGFRALVELLESTPMVRRQRMIEVGMAEDPDYTQKALSYMFTFEDILHLPDVELAELMAVAPPRMVAFAIRAQPDDVKKRFIKNSKPQIGAEIRDYMSVEIGLREAGGAQLKLIESARQLERKGLISTKRLPLD